MRIKLVHKYKGLKTVPGATQELQTGYYLPNGLTPSIGMPSGKKVGGIR